jgi:hypothetical protein
MIVHGHTLISEELFERRFVCDLSACKGACCEVGDSGAPLEPGEALEIRKHIDAIKPYMTKRGMTSLAEQGTSVVDMDGELVTPIVQEYAECIYARKDRGGTWKCGIEKAFRDGKIPFHKPISCHLYPIRLSQVGEYEALNYHEWPICKPACSCGERLDVAVYRFLKEPLIRRYGEAWYAGLEVLHAEWEKERRRERNG